MPYIKKHIRQRLAPKATDIAHTPGELNFQITQLLDDYLALNGASYQSFNDIIGALEGAKLELYRRLVAPYEDEKREENGEVYHEILFGRANVRHPAV